MLVRFTLRIYMLVRFTLLRYMLVRFTLRAGVTCLYDLHCGFTLRRYMLVRFYIADLIDCTSYVNELKIKLLKSKFESCAVSSCSRSGTL